MSTYIWDFIIIGAVVLIFLVLIRRLPLAAEFQEKEVIKEKREFNPEKIAPSSLMSQADEAFEARNYKKAEELYIRIATSEPNNAKVYAKLGLIYLDQKNYYDAKDAFLQAIKLEPDNIDYNANLSAAYSGLKDYFKASQALLKALEKEPKNKKYRDLYEKAQKALEREKKRKK